jgi:hypothetical protein
MTKRLFLALTLIVCALASAFATSPENVRPLRFAWGAEVSGNVDMSAHDTSSPGINAEFGMQWSWIRFLGIGAEADVAVSNSTRAIPVMAIFRTDFSRTRKLLFMDLRGGFALNYPYMMPQSTNPYASAGVGVTLATGKTFSSHLIMAYTYMGIKECRNGDYLRDCPGYSYASIRLGVQF